MDVRYDSSGQEHETTWTAKPGDAAAAYHPV